MVRARPRFILPVTALMLSLGCDPGPPPGEPPGPPPGVPPGPPPGVPPGPPGDPADPVELGGDLVVRFVQRQPALDYVWESSDPAVEGWPATGDAVTWTAMVRNTGTEDAGGMGYRWELDGAVVAEGAVDVPAGGEASVAYATTWSFDRHALTLVLDPDDAFVETEEGNNARSSFTDAISVGLWVEQSVYDFFDEHQDELGAGRTTWEDWAQEQVEQWNSIFAAGGVQDRVRLDEITVVADGALPLSGGLASNQPDQDDRSVDLQWGFPAVSPAGDPFTDYYGNTTDALLTNPFFYDGALLHELGHARYLIDLYGFNVELPNPPPADPTLAGTIIDIEEDGAPVSGSAFMPYTVFTRVYENPDMGLMNGEYTMMDAYSTQALNLIAGHRAVSGNYNAPGNIGVFLDRDLPDDNVLTIVDPSGAPLSGASVKVYRSVGVPGSQAWYAKHYDDVADLEAVTDDQGQVMLGHCPFSDAVPCQIDHTYESSSGTLIVRVELGGEAAYGFLDATAFNMEYWAGHTTLGEHALTVDLQPCGNCQGEGGSGDPCEGDFMCQPGTVCWDETCVGEGQFHVSLSWMEDTDLDIYVRTPANNVIYYGNLTADGGELDVDVCVGSCVRPPNVENIWFDETALPGNYEAWAVNYDGRTAADFTLSVSGPLVTPQDWSASLPATGGASSMIYAFTVP